MPRALLLGASSQIGLDLLRRPPVGWSFEGAGRTDPRPWGAGLSRFHPVDLSDEGAVRTLLGSTDSEVWINLARQGEEPFSRPRADARAPPAGPNPTDPAWRVNAELPGWLAQEAKRRGRYLVHLSSDEVFDGSGGPYAEEDPPDLRSTTLSHVGYARGLGESRVYEAEGPRAILRVCRPYGARHPARPDWLERLWSDLSQGRAPPLLPPEMLTPTYVPDVTLVLGALLERRPSRLFHVASPELLPSTGFARALQVESGREPLGPAAPPEPGIEPMRWGLRIREVHKLDVRPLSFREGLRSLFGGPAGPVWSSTR